MGKMTAREKRFGFKAQGKFTCASGLSDPAPIVSGIVRVWGEEKEAEE